MPTKIPEWVKLALAVAGLLVTMTMWFGDVQADLRVETTERTMEDKSQREVLTRMGEDIHEIKALLQREMDEHHPRK